MIVIVPLRTNLSGLYRHRRGLGFTWSRLQGRKYNIRIAKLVFHAKESPIRTRDEVLSLVSSRSNSPARVYSPAIRIPPNPGLPHSPHDSQETARLNEDSQRSSLVDHRNSPTPPSQVLALTWQCDMWLHVAYGVYLVMLLIRVNCICLVNTLYLWIWHAFLFLVHTTSLY